VPVGMIEFLPQKLLKKHGLAPCRVDVENKETEERYILGKDFENYLFISCLIVSKNSQHQGIGKALLNHFLNSAVFEGSSGASVYVTQRDKKWDESIHWPAGPKEFYQKAGFLITKTMKNPIGYLLCCEKARISDTRLEQFFILMRMHIVS
jgi:ribosomal protein S18 acetylase RimI-like enzyme